MLGSTTICFELLYISISSQRSQLQAEAPELRLRLQTVLFDSSVCGVPGAKVASNPGQESDSDFDSDSVSESESFRLGPKVPLALLFTNGGGSAYEELMLLVLKLPSLSDSCKFVGGISFLPPLSRMLQVSLCLKKFHCLF